MISQLVTPGDVDLSINATIRGPGKHTAGTHRLSRRPHTDLGLTRRRHSRQLTNSHRRRACPGITSVAGRGRGPRCAHRELVRAPHQPRPASAGRGGRPGGAGRPEGGGRAGGGGRA
ncbi:MAG: hypothetical protein EOP01_04840 [Propionibacteriaceae bacterium]|nr:MAG: hypothetical protein EOP01_04840 [Propionibacteriaceae bacterium]